jgi:glycine oxidase
MARLLAFFVTMPQMMDMAKIDVIGAGIVGLWQAFFLQHRGHDVTLWDGAMLAGSRRASALAGAMLAPFCEGEPGHKVAQALGIESLPIWQEHYPGIVMAGTLVVASPRDRADLQRFAAQTRDYLQLGAQEITALEPALGNRFQEGLYFAGEGHAEPLPAMEFLGREARRLGAKVHDHPYAEDPGSSGSFVVDCRGLGARQEFKTLRGIRGERIVLKAPDVALSRPVRLLHPRIPFYIVPWSGGRFMIGATVIESDGDGPATLRSTAELLSCAYALIPELGEAQILDVAAGVRPAFPDNTPKIIVRSRRIFVNGLYRHGFLASPILAQLTADYIEKGSMREGVVFEDHGEW